MNFSHLEKELARLKRFPYYLFYHHDDFAATVTIYAVAHHKRQQNYWSDRLPS
jgi:mRNA-degrading endonuclease RelE of RelBE toxin-antitoxin system